MDLNLVTKFITRGMGKIIFKWLNFLIPAIILFIFIVSLDPLLMSIADKILLITFFALVWYAWETMNLRKEAQKQTNFLLTPYLRLQWNEDGIKNPEIQTPLQLINIGQGVAQTIEFQKCTINQSNVGIKSITAMSSGISGGSSVTQLQYQNEINPASPPILKDFSDNIEVEIFYKDIENNEYLAKMMSNNNFNDGFQILEQRRKDK